MIDHITLTLALAAIVRRRCSRNWRRRRSGPGSGTVLRHMAARGRTSGPPNPQVDGEHGHDHQAVPQGEIGTTQGRRSTTIITRKKTTASRGQQQSSALFGAPG